MLSSKIITLLSDGVNPYLEGKMNFNTPIAEFERLAKERADICNGCRYFKKEPIPFLRIKDNRVPELTDMACGKCGCELAYKVRQNIKTCSKWIKQ